MLNDDEIPQWNKIKMSGWTGCRGVGAAAAAAKFQWTFFS